MPDSYHGKILWVDLSARTSREEELPESIYREYLGGVGLGARILYDRMKAGVDPMGPDNVLGFLPGLLTDTGSIFSGRYMVVAKSPLTGMWGDANSGGFFSAEIKRCGYDGIFITGQASGLVYLYVSEKGCEIKEAGQLAGLSPEETDEAIRKQCGDAKIRVASIGPAGEKRSLISCIINDTGRAAGRSGLGAVMGCKRLKALAVRGKKRVPVKDKERINALNDIYISKLKAGPGFYSSNVADNIQQLAKMLRVIPFHQRLEQNDYKELLRRYGTSGAFTFGIEIGDTPCRNFQGISYRDFEQESRANRLDGKSLVKYQTKRYACQSCPLGCGGTVTVPEGKYRIEGTHKPEYETLAAFGSLCMNADLESIITINHLCNQGGIDTISTGVTAAFAIECFERGILTPEELGGLELRYGNADAIVELVKKIIARQGIGDLLADGVRVASQKIGKGSEKFAMHAGGQELPMHDPRQDPGWALAYVAEPAPGRHTAQSETYYQLMRISKKFRDLKPYPLLSLKSRRYRYDGRGVEHAATSKYVQALSSAGLCVFGALTGEVPLEEQIAAATGWELSADDWMTVGHRIQTVRQLFNAREEIKPSSLTLPERVLEAQEAGPFKKAFLDVEAMKKGFYRALQWDEETGVPTAECLQSLGIETVP